MLPTDGCGVTSAQTPVETQDHPLPFLQFKTQGSLKRESSRTQKDMKNKICF